MSLINDALKRADASRPTPTPPADTTPAAPVPPPVAPVTVAPEPYRPRRRGSLAILLVAGILVIGVAAGISHLRHGLAGPKQALAKVLQLVSSRRAPASSTEGAVASAESTIAVAPAPSAASVPAPPPVAPAPAETPATEPADTGGPLAEWPANDASYDMTAFDAADAVVDPPPEETEPTLALAAPEGGISLDADAALSAEAALADADAAPATFPTPIPVAAVAPAAPPADARETLEPAKAQAATPATAPATPTAPSATATQDASGAATFDTSKYRISSIVVGPSGATALVNSRPVRVGDALGDARVVAITAWTVEVDCGGRRTTLRR